MANIQKNAQKTKNTAHRFELDRKNGDHDVYNLETVLRSRYQFRYNEIQNIYEYTKLGSDDWEPVNEGTLWHETNLTIKHAQTTLLTLLTSKSISPYYNVVQEWVKKIKISEEFKDTCVFEHLGNFIESEDEGGGRIIALSLKKHLIRAVKCIFDPLYPSKQCFVLIGSQSIGKTPFFKGLLPPNMQCFIKESPHLSPSNKDGRIELSSNIMMLIDEVDNYFENIDNRRNYKAYMTTTTINDRLPYGRSNISRNRIASFFGTGNTSKFLNDDTGTDRWVVHSVKGFKNKSLGYSGKDAVENFPFLQLWAAAYNAWRSGETGELSRDELVTNNENNEIYKFNTPEYEVLIEHISPAKKEDAGAIFGTATEIMRYLNDVQEGLHAIKFESSRKLGGAAVRAGFVPKKIKRKGISVQGYYYMKNCEKEEIPTSNAFVPF